MAIHEEGVLRSVVKEGETGSERSACRLFFARMTWMAKRNEKVFVEGETSPGGMGTT
jgi:hypothetical protein